MEILKRTMSALLAMVLLFGMLPMPLAASATVDQAEPAAIEETTVPTTEAVSETEETQTTETEETEPVAATPIETEPVVTEPEVTEPEETEPEVTESEVTEPEETEPEETEPEETEPDLTGRTPLMPESYYWYTTQKSYSETKPVTVIEANEDGTWSSYETTETVSGTYKELQEVYVNFPVTLSIEDYSGGGYTFTTFEDLEELASGTYDSDVGFFAKYVGEGPLVIERDITMPYNMILSFMDDNATMIIPEGVTFESCESVSNNSFGTNLDSLTVNGTYIVNGFVHIYEDLTVNGQITLKGGNLYVDPDTVVTGGENVVSSNVYQYQPYVRFFATTTEELAAAIDAANSDTLGWTHQVQSNGYTAMTIDQSLVIPENVEFNRIWGDAVLTIAQGCTLTINSSLATCATPLVVDGELVNNCENFYLHKVMTINGSYSGTGTIYIPSSGEHGFASWEDAVIGLDTSEYAISKASWGSWWQIKYISDKTQLGAPSNLQWNKTVDYSTDGLLTNYGSIAYKPGYPNLDCARMQVYNASTNEQVGSWTWSFGGQTSEYRSVDSFILMNPESGTYYFTVTSVPNQNGSDSSYYDSETVKSINWTYTKPSASLGQCTNLTLNGPLASWTAPSNATSNTRYEILWFFTPEEGGTPYQVQGSWGFTGTSFQLYTPTINRNGAGYYSYQVRAISENITQKCNGAYTSSDSVYIDPESFSVNEQFLQDQIDKGYNFVEVTCPVVLENDFTIPENVSLSIYNGGSLTVPSGVTLNLNAYSTSLSEGKLVVQPGGVINIANNVWANFNAVVDIQGTATFLHERTWVNTRYYGGWVPSSVSGVPKEHHSLFITIGSQLTQEQIDMSLDLFENHDFGWSAMSIQTSMTLPRDLTIAENSILMVEGMGSNTVTIPAGITLTNNGEIYIWDGHTLQNNGILLDNGAMFVYSNLNNTGRIDVNSWMYVSQNGVVTNTGVINASSPDCIGNDGTWKGNKAVANYMTHDDLQNMLNAAAAGQQVVLTEPVTLEKDLTINNYKTLMIGHGAYLVVPSGKTLTINENCGLIIADDATFIVYEDAKLVNNGTITSQTTVEKGGRTGIYGTYNVGNYGTLYVNMGEGTPNIYGVDTWMQTASYWDADEADLLEAVELEGYGAVQVQTDNMVLNTDVTIPYNMSFIINPTWDDIDAGGALYNPVIINSNVTVRGLMWINAYYNETPCDLELNGSITVKADGALYVSGNVYNNGNIYRHFSGYIANYQQKFDAVWEGPGIQDVGDMTQYQLEQALANAEDTYILTSSVVISRDMILNHPLQIEEDGFLYVTGGATLTVNAPLILATEGRVTIESGSKLVNNYAIECIDYEGYGYLFLRNSSSYVSGKDANGNPGVVLVHANDDYIAGVQNVPTKYQYLIAGASGEGYVRQWLDFAKEGYQCVDITAPNLWLNEDIVIPKNVILRGYTEDSSIPAMVNNGAMTVNGVVTAMFGPNNLPGNVLNSGSITVNNGGEFHVYGTFEGNLPVSKGGKIYPQATAVIINGDEAYNVDTVEAESLILDVDVLSAGGNAIQAVTWTSSNKKVVDPANMILGQDGIYTLTNVGVGTTKLTATTIDGTKLTDVITLTVTPVQTESLTLSHGIGGQDSDAELVLDKADLANTEYSFTIKPTALDKRGLEIAQTNKTIKWTSSDTKLAAIKANTDGSVTVTIKAGAHGVAQITAQTTDLAKVTATMNLTVMDLTPRLGSTSVTVDPMDPDGSEIALVSSYGNDIVDVELLNGDFSTEYDATRGILTIKANSFLKNGTANQVLRILCENGETYYPTPYLKVTVKSVLPTVTIKQNEKMDLFYTDSEATFTVTSKNGAVTGLEMTGTDDFEMDENGVIHFTETFVENILENPKYKANTKATLKVYVDGYVYPVEKAITITTTTTKPKVVLTAASSVINTAMGNPVAGFAVYNQATGEFLVDSVQTVTVTQTKAKEDFAIPTIQGEDTDTIADDLVLLTLTGTEGGTATITVQADNWTQSMKLTHKVTVQTKVPTVKAVNLELNNIFYWCESGAYLAADQTNVAVKSLENITSTTKGAEKLDIRFDNGGVIAKIKDEYQTPELAPKAGTYTFTATPYLHNGTAEGYALKPVTIKVKVVATAPTVKLAATSVKMNRNLAPNETGTVNVTVTNDYGFALTGFEGLDAFEPAVKLNFDQETRQLQVTLEEGVPAGSYVYTLYPQFQQPGSTEHTAQLPKALKLTVQVYDGKDPTVTQSAKGKLDAIDPTSEILYTVSKVNNALGVIDEVILESGVYDNDLFQLTELGLDAKGKQTFALKLKDGVTYSTKQTYQVVFTYSICGKQVNSAIVKIKVTQSALKVTAPVVQYYQAQSLPMSVKVSLTSPVNAKIAQIDVNTAKTSKELVSALGLSNGETIYIGESAAELGFVVENPGSLVAGKSYKLVLDITPEGHASDAKTTQITVTVKVAK